MDEEAVKAIEEIKDRWAAVPLGLYKSTLNERGLPCVVHIREDKVVVVATINPALGSMGADLARFIASAQSDIEYLLGVINNE